MILVPFQLNVNVTRIKKDYHHTVTVFNFRSISFTSTMSDYARTVKGLSYHGDEKVIDKRIGHGSKLCLLMLN